jgi:hypothetical protein
MKTSRAVRIAIPALTRRQADDPLLELSGDIDDLPADLSDNVDRYLEETFRPEPPAARRPRRRARKAVRR